MASKQRKVLAQLYVSFLTKIAPFYTFVCKRSFANRSDSSKQHIVLLISRAHDVELLIGLHDKSREDESLSVSFWIVKKCVRREPKVLAELKEKNVQVEMIVSFRHLGKVLKKLMRVDTFLSTVESTTSQHKLPYVITGLANAVGVSTYTMQHGFENVGLTYCDDIHGPEVTFSAKTVLTWGPTEELPAWVNKETRDKAVAVGCPKPLVVTQNTPLASAGELPIIGVFDNLHWHRYDEEYAATFLDHLEETARQRREFHFVLKSHPDSIRNRSMELEARLRVMENVEIADLSTAHEPALTTPLLLSQALGVITTPSTIALDGALAQTPVAVTRYGLELSYYSPLTLLDSLEDWQVFLDKLLAREGTRQLKRNGEHFLKRVLVSGDAPAKILALLAGQK